MFVVNRALQMSNLHNQCWGEQEIEQSFQKFALISSAVEENYNSTAI